ncbi:MAG TPA: TonB-dependent receptor [Steroidobacteraceae bacterium]|jgi:outer membrane receptor protein involved in Fe transport
MMGKQFRDSAKPRKSAAASRSATANRAATRPTLLDLAVTACIFAARAAGADQSAPSTASAGGGAELAEVTVTAQRRTENLQDVPIAIQAITGETLQQLSVENFDDVIKYLPNVTLAGNGPGQGNIYMRGLSVGPGTIQGSGAIGDFPNVAVYLDDQSAQVPGRNLDIYAADLERIEVLEGPQGTLFGAGAEAGVVRYITNKPKINVTEGTVNAGYAITAHGDPSSNVDAAINLPVIADTLAVRAVVYSDSRGGYIDNVPGTFVRQSTDGGIHYAGYVNNIPGPATALNSVNNNNLVANNINPVTYKGIRAGALWKFNDEWNALLVQSYQSMEADGVFFETPQSSGSAPEPLPDLSVQLYNPSFDKDRFENTALTVNGRIGALNFVYSGAYLIRNVQQVQDYTNYARGTYADYYQCLSPAQTGNPGQCYSPSTTWHDTERDVHQSHEMRLSTPDDWRMRAIAGVFWEDYVIHEQTDWLYKTAPGFTNVGPPPGATSNNPNTRNDNEAFFDDVTRGYKQRAAFASVDIDIVPKTLTFTAGTRYYHFDNTEVGSAVSTFGCYQAGPPPCLNGALNLNDEGLKTSYAGFKSRANLTWKITPDILLYYTWSQGFRPGGFNRSSHYSSTLNYASPLAFEPDTLTNNELGWKTQWFDHRLQLNGAVYQEDWKNVQTTFFDPQAGLGNLAFETNGPDYRVRGVEVALVARVTDALTLTGSSAWNSSSQTNSPYVNDVTGAPITSIPNPYGQLGSTLAMSPPFSGNLRARYEFESGEYRPFLQVGGQHQAHSHSATGYVQNYDQAAFTTYDAFAGVAKDAWTVQLYCENLSDTRADMFTSSSQSVKAITVNRPRTAGLKFSYKFGDK